MTEQTQPTDAEILDAADDFRSQYKHGGTTFDEFDALGFARAVLAKWGTPAGAVEPDRYMDDRGYTVTKEWLDSDDATSDYRAAYTTPVYLTPQPTHEQAGAVPLTDEQSHALLERMATEADQWAEGLSYEPTREQLSGWCVAFIQREIQAAHGIKGGQHG